MRGGKWSCVGGEVTVDTFLKTIWLLLCCLIYFLTCCIYTYSFLFVALFVTVTDALLVGHDVDDVYILTCARCFEPPAGSIPAMLLHGQLQPNYLYCHGKVLLVIDLDCGGSVDFSYFKRDSRKKMISLTRPFMMYHLCSSPYDIR